MTTIDSYIASSPRRATAPDYMSSPPDAPSTPGHTPEHQHVPSASATPSGRFDLAALLAGNSPRHMLDLHERHINPAMAGVLKTIGFDVPFVRAQGAYLFDESGNRYLDCLGGYAVFACGRNHPVIADALAQALHAELPNLPGIGIVRLAGLLAKELLAIAPGTFDKVQFASGGAEAVDIALKQARITTGREKFVFCHRAYHGLTVGALSVTGNHEFREGFGPLLASTTEIPFDDLAALEQALAKRDVAAFIVEPIQGKGVNIPSAGYLKGVSELCTKYGTLMILDEIQTGLGRTGRWWACEHDGAGTTWQPDVLLVAKALSGGSMPTSAVLCRNDVHRAVFPSMNHCSRIQNTFSMNDLSMVAGLAMLHVMRTERIVENAAAIGTYLRDALAALCQKYCMLRSVRGRGLMIALEFARPSGLRNAPLAIGWDLLHKADPSLFCQSVIMPLMSDHRILAQVAGHRLDVIKLMPPLVFSKQDADDTVAALDATIGAIHHFPGPMWEVGKKLTGAAMKRFKN